MYLKSKKSYIICDKSYVITYKIRVIMKLSVTDLIAIIAALQLQGEIILSGAILKLPGNRYIYPAGYIFTDWNPEIFPPPGNFCCLGKWK